ncbi:hypothetical protein VTO42DRAFT_5719 [Malbranchea cinnamomea]
MGKGGRIACIFLPYVLSIGALVCLILVGLGSTSTNSPPKDIYFLRIDLHDINVDTSDVSRSYYAIGKGLQQADAAGKLEDFYTIGLWNHCYGEYDNGKYRVTKCTERTTKYWFNPIEVWDLDDDVEDLLPSKLEKGIDVYRKVAGWLFTSYIVALVATAVQLLVGISAIFSRWGSFATTIFAAVASLFTIAATATATALYGVLAGAIRTGLKPFNIKATLGKDMFVITWFAVFFALAGGLFWLFSVCCCSGRSPYSHDNRGRGILAEKTPYTYERVHSPYGGPAYGAGPSVPLNTMPAHRDAAYEPYRHEQPH